MKQHTEDYKETAVKYYLENKEDMRNTCKIFKCKFQSLARWIKTYKNKGNINRKTRKNHNLKITPEIEKFKVRLNDKSIYNILHKHKLTRKRL